ncbi:MAG TPA: class I SAM-dependent methyltransferase [Candidatus Nanoarchaeia archaeon]|nr:class I SAM-dependent methyltransferase [Candidatus Nanoarchaeia archaeon]
MAGKSENSKTMGKYDRAAGLYDIFELPLEKIWFSRWRKKYISPLKGRILEVGIGTGKNIPYYSQYANVTGIDFSRKMLERAEKRLERSGKKNIELKLMDAEKLEFEDNSFDYVVTSCVFCSVPDPVKGLKEIKRVLRPSGKLVMIEHVLSSNKAIAFIEKLHNPIMRFLTGTEINRDTKKNIQKAGLRIIKDIKLALFDVFRLFEAGK